MALYDVEALDDVGPLNDFEEHLLGLFSGVLFCGLIITPKSVTTLGVSMPFNWIFSSRLCVVLPSLSCDRGLGWWDSANETADASYSASSELV